MNNKAPADKFDLESVFKTLDEIEIPKVKGGVLPNRAVITERFNPSKQTDLLLEDYYDITSTDGLDKAQEAREDDVAKAKLARIEKIVDLDAESPDEILPSYVGKVIVQCPQCMTLFYKNKEDIVPSEDDPETVNIEEICQHCGNDSGYTIVGKVAEETPEETAKETATEETTTEEAPTEETTEETTTEETAEEAPVEETVTEETTVEEIPEEPANESLIASKVLKDAVKDNDLAPKYKGKCTLIEAKEDDEADWEVKTDDIIDLINQKLNLTTDEETGTLVITAKDADPDDDKAAKLEVELTPDELKVFDTYTQQLDDGDFFSETEETEEEAVEDDLTEDMNLKQNRDVMHAIRDAKLDLETVDFNTADDDIDFDSDEGQFTYDEKTAYIDPCFYLDTKGYADVYESSKPINAVVRDILKIYPIYKRTINLSDSKTNGKELEVITLYDNAGDKRGKRIQVKGFKIDPQEELLIDTLDKARSTGGAVKLVDNFGDTKKRFKSYCYEFNEEVIDLDIKDTEAVEKLLAKLAQSDNKEKSFAIVLKNYKENDPEAEEALRKFLRDKQKIHDRTIVVDFKKDASDVNRKLFRYVADLDSVVTESLEKLAESKKRILNEEALEEAPKWMQNLKDKHAEKKVAKQTAKEQKNVAKEYLKMPTDEQIDLAYGEIAPEHASEAVEKVRGTIGYKVITFTGLDQSQAKTLKTFINAIKGKNLYISQRINLSLTYLDDQLAKVNIKADQRKEATYQTFAGNSGARAMAQNGSKGLNTISLVFTLKKIAKGGDILPKDSGSELCIAAFENTAALIDIKYRQALGGICAANYAELINGPATQNTDGQGTEEQNNDGKPTDEKPAEGQNTDEKPTEEQNAEEGTEEQTAGENTENANEKPAEESPEQSSKPLTAYYSWTAYGKAPFTFRFGTKDKIGPNIDEEGLDGSTLGKAIETAGKLNTEYGAQIVIVGALPNGKSGYVGTVKDGKVVNEDEIKVYLDKKNRQAKVENFNYLTNIDEKTLNEHLTRYFTNVYENVKSFKATSCSQKENSLFIEGLIKFNTGRENKTSFKFKLKESNGNKITLLGKNRMLSESVAFKLNGSVLNNNLITENLKYNYKINNDSVKGSTKK